jgi:hypothetical protein
MAKMGVFMKILMNITIIGLLCIGSGFVYGMDTEESIVLKDVTRGSIIPNSHPSANNAGGDSFLATSDFKIEWNDSYDKIVLTEMVGGKGPLRFIFGVYDLCKQLENKYGTTLIPQEVIPFSNPRGFQFYRMWLTEEHRNQIISFLVSHIQKK